MSNLYTLLYASSGQSRASKAVKSLVRLTFWERGASNKCEMLCGKRIQLVKTRA